MAYISQLPIVLEGLGYAPLDDFVAVRQDDGSMSISEWLHVDAQPTEEQIADYANDVTPLPSGQLFSAWYAEHGGNPILTAKRKAKEIQESQEELGRVIRAIVLLLVDDSSGEINVLRTWLRDFVQVIANANSLGDIKAGVATLPALPNRTAAQAKAAIEAIIEGE